MFPKNSFHLCAMPSYTDQLGNTITVKQAPQRIISLVPSQTELLYDLGLDDEVVGITKFCIHPDEWYKEKTKVGGTKKLKLSKIAELKPDLIIANKEENEKWQIEDLQGLFPVWVSDISTLEGALEMISTVGEMTGKKDRAGEIVKEIKTGFKGLQKLVKGQPKKSAAYLIWQRPYMTIGEDTFIYDLMKRCGMVNCFDEEEYYRYPTVTIDQIKEEKPDLVLLSSEPFPFKEIHQKEIQEWIPKAKVVLVDGEMFSWYGSRLMKAPVYFSELIGSF